MMTVTLALIVKWVSLDYAQATPVGLDWKYYTTVAFVAVDVLVIASFAAVLAIFASSPGFILLGTMGFVLTARSYAAVIGMLSQNSTLVDDAASYQAGLGVLGYFLPNLGWLDVRGVALYGHWDFLPVDWLMGLLGLVLYAVFLVGVAIWGLQHKRFA